MGITQYLLGSYKKRVQSAKITECFLENSVSVARFLYMSQSEKYNRKQFLTPYQVVHRFDCSNRARSVCPLIP